MHSESPALRREVLAIVSIALQSPAGRQTDRAFRRLGRSPTDDPAADAIRLAMEKPGRLNAVLYQFTGGPGVAGGSIWYSPRPGERAGQLVGKTGGALGWVEPENLPAGLDAAHPYAIAITGDATADSSGTTTTDHWIVLIDPATGTQTEVAHLGVSIGDEESSTGGSNPYSRRMADSGYWFGWWAP